MLVGAVSDIDNGHWLPGAELDIDTMCICTSIRDSPLASIKRIFIGFLRMCAYADPVESHLEVRYVHL